MLKNKFNCFILLIAFLIGIAFSMRWLYPLYIQANSNSEFSFIPVRYAPNTESDDYYYYSHIREIIDGNIPSHDPATYENKDKYTAHIVYTFSLLMCSIAGILTGSTEYAYYFNFFVYPMINFIVIYLLFYLITRTKGLSVLLSLLVILSSGFFRLRYIRYIFDFVNTFFLKLFGSVDIFIYSDLTRTPNILFNNIPLFICVIFLFMEITNKRNSAFITVPLIFFLGISSLTSPQNLFILYFIFICVILMHLNERDRVKRFGIILFSGLIISTPGIIFLINANKMLIDIINNGYNCCSPEVTKPNLYVLLSGLMTVLPPFIFLLLFKYSNKKFIVSSLSGIICSFILWASLKGFWGADEIMNRGGGLLYATIVLCGFVLTIMEIVKNKEIVIGIFSKNLFKIKLPHIAIIESEKTKYFSKILMIVLSLGIAVSMVLNQYLLIKPKYIHYNAPDFKELYQWFNKNSNKNEVALTLDFDLLTNLIVYSPVNVYIPQAVLSPASHEERFMRFYETAKIYGFNPNELRTFLNGMIPHYRMSESRNTDDIRMALMQLVLFYCKYNLPKKEKEKMVDDYTRILNDKDRTLNYKADYLILSKFDENLVHKGSLAEELQDKKHPIFKNNFYKVYKLSGI